MDWAPYLEEGETVRWEAKPAPRCFTFRNWRHSVFGLLLLILTVYWEMVGVSVGETYQLPFLAWIPLPFMFAAVYFSIGHVVIARLEWDRVFYAATNRRLLVRRGLLRERLLTLPLEEVTWFRLKPLGEELGSLNVVGGDPAVKLVFSCLEYPRRLTALLEAVMAENPAGAVEFKPEP